MELVVDAAKPVPADVGIDLRRRDLAVAEHELDRAQVRPALEQVRRERMPEDVGTDLGGQAGGRGVLAEKLPDPLPGERAAAPRQEKLLPRAALDARPDLSEIALDRGAGRTAERHDPFLAALAAADEEAVLEVDLGELQGGQLGDPQAGAVE